MRMPATKLSASALAGAISIRFAVSRLIEWVVPERPVCRCYYWYIVQQRSEGVVAAAVSSEGDKRRLIQEKSTVPHRIHLRGIVHL
jgi:hypothetical protein